MRFTNSSVVITGAGAGIGQATAEAFAAEGALLTVCELNEQRLDKLVSHLKQLGVQVIGLVGDVSKVDDCNKLIDAALATFGKVDVLVNNAGIVDRFLPVGEMTDEVWQRVMGVNLNGPMYTMRRSVPAMLKQGKGVIVNVVSVAGITGAVAGAAYTASKHAMIGLTENTAWMYATKGIRAVSVCPGAVKTSITLGGEPSAFGAQRLQPIMGGIPRQGEPEELARLILFLASDEASFVNGATITADGGWMAG